MAIRNTPSVAPSAPKDSRLAAFAAQIADEASGKSTTPHSAFAAALNKPKVIASSKLWLNFAKHVNGSEHPQAPACRVLPPAYDLLPLP